MDQALIQQQLKDGIQAIRRGDRARGRELLLQVVAADERSEPAWLWLSQAVDAPADQLTALENALTLNPANDAVRARVAALRQELGLAQEAGLAASPAPARAAPSPGEAPPAPEAPPADYDVLDNDPDQCLYCGKLTEPEASACPHCGRSLLKSGFHDSTSAYRMLVFLSAVFTQFAILQPGLALAELLMKSGDFPAYLSSAPFLLMAGRIFLWAVGFLVIISSQAAAPNAALAVGLVDWAAIGFGFISGWIAPPTAAALAALDFVLVSLGTIIRVGRAQARVRQYAVLDRDASGHVEMYRRGRHYAQQGKWALAAIHWQKAMVLKPYIAEYYQDLSAAQVRLGRYPQALRTLRTGAEMLPEDPEFPARIAAIEGHAQSEAAVRQKPK